MPCCMGESGYASGGGCVIILARSRPDWIEHAVWRGPLAIHLSDARPCPQSGWGWSGRKGNPDSPDDCASFFLRRNPMPTDRGYGRNQTDETQQNFVARTTGSTIGKGL